MNGEPETIRRPSLLRIELTSSKPLISLLRNSSILMPLMADVAGQTSPLYCPRNFIKLKQKPSEIKSPSKWNRIELGNNKPVSIILSVINFRFRLHLREGKRQMPEVCWRAETSSEIEQWWNNSWGEQQRVRGRRKERRNIHIIRWRGGWDIEQGYQIGWS